VIEMPQRNLAKFCRMVSARLPILCLVLAMACVALAQQGKSGSAKTDLTGRYEGTAKNKAEEVITVSIDLTEKEGALSGTINSSHGDFPITGGAHKGDAVTLEFEAGGSGGTISLHMAEDKLVGSWSAGDDGGAVDVKRVAAQEGGAKGKS
jgi:hypothetical protein